ncbi:hypothetical protein [Candidatus Pelagibacter sp. HIMB1495]|uniref:hypothetical protein n=1 Tax=unclassified Candidatus Pelagibacter TaxID=2647897 RepID=UPI003F87C91F
MKKIFLLILIIITYSCGFTSVYKNYDGENIFIKIKNIDGDREINNYIKNQIKIASSLESENIYDLSINTIYKKNIVTKDVTGKATDYKLTLDVIVTVHSKNNQILKFTEEFNTKKREDYFEEKNYEREIKRNFSESIKDKIILNLLKNNDN